MHVIQYFKKDLLMLKVTPIWIKNVANSLLNLHNLRSQTLLNKPVNIRL